MKEQLLFETFVVGSLPRPRWIQDVINDREAGRLSRADADRLLDAAVPSAIRLQERAGLTYVSDGEWRRDSYTKVFSEHVDGFADVQRAGVAFGAAPDPCVVSPLHAREPVTVDAARFLRENTSHRTIVAIPSPFMLGWRMWDAAASASAYATRYDFMEACAAVLREEVALLGDLGIDHVQIDEPWLLMLNDSSFRVRYAVADFEREIDDCVRLVNTVVEGADRVGTSLHLCHGHFNRQRATSAGYEEIMPALGLFRVDRIAMEFAWAGLDALSVLADFPAEKVLGLGVIDHCDARVETPDDVETRAQVALRYVAAARLTLNPDCGFAPRSENPADLDEAYLKLRALCRGAEALRASASR